LFEDLRMRLLIWDLWPDRRGPMSVLWPMMRSSTLWSTRGGRRHRPRRSNWPPWPSSLSADVLRPSIRRRSRSSRRTTICDEVAAALTLTANAADDLIDFAVALKERLPRVAAALRAGDLDYCKARTIWHSTVLLDEALTSRIEEKALTRASAQTTGEIRAKIRRLVRRLDPGAAEP